MGYYTNYNLEIIEGSFKSTTEPCSHCGGTGSSCIEHDFPMHIKDNLDGETKWYEHQADMKSFSKKYPKVTFKLSGTGEEQGDVWVKFFRNGKVVERRSVVNLDDTAPTDWK